MSFALLTCKAAWGDGIYIHLHFYRQASTCSARAPSPVFAAHLNLPFPLERKKEKKKAGVSMILYAIWHRQYSIIEIHDISHSLSLFNPILDKAQLIKKKLRQYKFMYNHII